MPHTTERLYSAAVELWLDDKTFILTDPALTNTDPADVPRHAARSEPSQSQAAAGTAPQEPSMGDRVYAVFMQHTASWKDVSAALPVQAIYASDKKLSLARTAAKKRCQQRWSGRPQSGPAPAPASAPAPATARPYTGVTIKRKDNPSKQVVSRPQRRKE